MALTGWAFLAGAAMVVLVALFGPDTGGSPLRALSNRSLMFSASSLLFTGGLILVAAAAVRDGIVDAIRNATEGPPPADAVPSPAQPSVVEAPAPVTPPVATKPHAEVHRHHPETQAELQALLATYARTAAEDGEMITSVVGDTFNNDDGSSRQEIIGRCKPGEALLLRPDIGNKYDPNAVGVYRATTGEQIGFLSRERAAFLHPLFQQGLKSISAAITDITGGTADKPVRGVNIEARLAER